jgi:TonB family protein
MFETLLASRTDSSSGLPTWGIVAALILHGVAIGAAIRTPDEPSDGPPLDPGVFVLPPEALPGPARGGPVAPPGVSVPPDLRLPPPLDVFSQIGLPPLSRGFAAGPGLIPGEPPLPGSGGGPIAASLVQEPPVLLAAAVPDYPARLHAAGIEGDVVVEAVVDTSGRVERGTVRIVRSSAPGFEPPALQVIAGARFRPARQWGRAVRVLVRLPVAFRLR